MSSELWIPGQNGQVKPLASTTFQHAKELHIMTITDTSGVVVGAVLSFPTEGIGYPVKDADQLDEIALNLQDVAKAIRNRRFRVVPSRN